MRLYEILKQQAVFVVAPIEGGYAATTRASDRGEHGRIGLPGGKVDDGETLVQAAYRESYEEGFIMHGINETPIHNEERDGFNVTWFEAAKATRLEDYKEKHRIKNIIVSIDELANSGFGNSFLRGRYR
jgi:hypothetical protein